jgi:hypothetical protein
MSPSPLMSSSSWTAETSETFEPRAGKRNPEVLGGSQPWRAELALSTMI